MSCKARTKELFRVVTAAIVVAFSTSAFAAVDADAAKASARQNNCFKCHSVDKEKDGPSYSKVAAKYRGKPDAEQRLITHITTGEKAKFPDGHEEDHKIIKTKDMAEIKNLIDWILSQ
jgi:cytochrome c